MKISAITCTLLGSILLSASSVIADSRKFKFPPADSTFSPGDTIRFLTRDTPDFERDSVVTANLYSDNGEFVKVVERFYGERDDDNLQFYYKIDPDLVSGRYYVELSNENNPEDTASSYTFNIMGDEEYQYPIDYLNDPQYLDYGGNMGYPF